MSVHDDHNSVLPHLPEAHLVVLSSCDVYRVYELFLHGEETPVPVPVDEDGPLRAGRYPYRGKGMDLEDYDKLDIEPAYLRRGGTVLRLGLPGSRGGRGSHLQDQDVAACIGAWPDNAAQKAPRRTSTTGAPQVHSRPKRIGARPAVPQVGRLLISRAQGFEPPTF